MHFSSPLSGRVLLLLSVLSASASLFVNGWLREYQRSLPSIYATQFQRLRSVNFNNVRHHTPPLNPSVPPEAINKDTSNSSGLVLTLNLTDYQQTFWTTNISVGTPASTYRVVIAPFASDLILASVGAVYNGSDASFLPLYSFLNGGGGGSSAETLAGRQEYNASASNTSSSVGSSGYQNFMNDSGLSVTDTVGLGGVSGGWNLTFAAADTVDFLIDQLPVDGLLGLDGSLVDGPSSTLPVPFIQQLIAAGALAEPTVQVALTRGQDTADGTSTLTMGGTDPADYITRTSVSKCELSVKDNGLLKDCAPELQFDTWFALGQQFLNSRCLQVDLSTGVWGVSSRAG